ncbi:Wound-induced polypeptide 3 [Hibiscus trionum]|uniref:Wound-induced polypeptide 3 n=1 Tax=Hibiscus trionum TaxID=183268 RepID=A0A9W7HVV2_HIBTR|nr:Wound-induced polypeptide 3 [Hibiscus trionum]
MSAPKRAWIVAASIYAVEALKDQGICRWNYTLRLAKNNLNRSYSSLRSEARSEARSEVSSTTARAMSGKIREEKMMKPEKSMKKVMELNSWGPSTIRF